LTGYLTVFCHDDDIAVRRSKSLRMTVR